MTDDELTAGAAAELVRKIRDEAIAASFDTTDGDGSMSTVVDLAILESILLAALLDVGR